MCGEPKEVEMESIQKWKLQDKADFMYRKYQLVGSKGPL